MDNLVETIDTPKVHIEVLCGSYGNETISKLSKLLRVESDRLRARLIAASLTVKHDVNLDAGHDLKKRLEAIGANVRLVNAVSIENTGLNVTASPSEAARTHTDPTNQQQGAEVTRHYIDVSSRSWTAKRVLKYVFGSASAILLGSACFYYWTTTPTYALLQLRNAIADGNQILFAKHVNLPLVANNAIDNLMSNTETLSSASKIPGSGTWASVGYYQAIERLATNKDLAVNEFISDASASLGAKYKEKRDLVVLDDSFRPRQLMQTLGLDDVRDLSFDISRLDGTVKASLEVDRPDINYYNSLVVSLEKRNSVWTVTQLDNLPAVLNEIKSAERVVLERANESMAEIMRSEFEALQWDGIYRPSISLSPSVYDVVINFRSVSSRDIASFAGAATLYHKETMQAFDSLPFAWEVEGTPVINGKVGSIILSTEATSANAPLAEIAFNSPDLVGLTMNVLEITYMDGRKIGLYRSYQEYLNNQ